MLKLPQSHYDLEFVFQNDPGINGHFSTYMKARIFCEREVPPGRQFNGAVDYHYNEIRKFIGQSRVCGIHSGVHTGFFVRGGGELYMYILVLPF